MGAMAVTFTGYCQCWECRNVTGGHYSNDPITITISLDSGRYVELPKLVPYRPHFPPEARAAEPLPLPPRSASRRAPWLAGRYIARASRVRARGRILRARIARSA